MMIPPQIALIIPTFNERNNIRPLVASISTALQGIEWEAIIVDDDSPDGTYNEIIEVAGIDARVRPCLHIGVGRGGFLGAAEVLFRLAVAFLLPLEHLDAAHEAHAIGRDAEVRIGDVAGGLEVAGNVNELALIGDRKSTRLNSSHT